jgi:hypothetical protein
MIPRNDFLANIDLVGEFSGNQHLLEGALVECGTWRGGMSAAMMEVGGTDRDYHFFDSFEGLPPAKEIDGSAALEWQGDKAGQFYFDNCTATVDEFHQTLAMTGMPLDRVHVHAGFFEDTMRDLSIPRIAVLRLDADWYDSTMTCLKALFDKVLPGGIILIDDYYYWDGCSRAVHEFLARRQARERIREAGESLAIMIKADEQVPVDPDSSCSSTSAH